MRLVKYFLKQQISLRSNGVIFAVNFTEIGYRRQMPDKCDRIQCVMGEYPIFQGVDYE